MPQLLEPCSLKHLRLRNRAVVAPMTRVSAEPEGAANELMRDYYASFAKGGFGMIVSEGVYTDTAYSQGYFNQPGLATDAHRDSWKPIVQAVHEAGAAFIAQLMHGGPDPRQHPSRPPCGSIGSTTERISAEVLWRRGALRDAG